MMLSVSRNDDIIELKEEIGNVIRVAGWRGTQSDRDIVQTFSANGSPDDGATMPEIVVAAPKFRVDRRPWTVGSVQCVVCFAAQSSMHDVQE